MGVWIFRSEWPDRDKTMEGEGEWSWSAASSNQQPAARRAALIFAAAASVLLIYLSGVVGESVSLSVARK